MYGRKVKLFSGHTEAVNYIRYYPIRFYMFSTLSFAIATLIEVLHTISWIKVFTASNLILLVKCHEMRF